jgi:hypothetical protein
MRVLHPKQFEVNEAWIAFRLNSSPIETEEDGDFNCIALMDAASCFIFGTELIPLSSEEPAQLQIRRLLRDAQQQKQQLPKTLYIPREDAADLLTLEAQKQKIDVVRLPENELMVFIGEARDSYEEWASRSGGEA